MIPEKGQALQLEEIYDIAEATFLAQIAKARKHPEYHDQFFDLRWGGVKSHVSIQCHGKPEMTKTLVERCVRRQWSIKKVQEALAKMAPAPAAKRPYRRSEHKNGNWAPHVIFDVGGGTGGLPIA